MRPRMTATQVNNTDNHTPWCPGCPDIPSPGGRIRLCVQDPMWLVLLITDMEKASQAGVWKPPSYLESRDTLLEGMK